MDLNLTEEQRAVQKTARDFAERRLAPAAHARDKIGRAHV